MLTLLGNNKRAAFEANTYFAFSARGETQPIRIQGGQSKKLSGNPNISFQLHCNPRISANFKFRNLYININILKQRK